MGAASLSEGTVQAADAGPRAPDVAGRLAFDIQGGVFPAGTWLKQIDLERRYGAKRMDVRRALDLLVQRRLVQHAPNRGYHVFSADPRLSRDLRDIRVALETAAADGIVRNATASDIAALGALCDRFDALVREGTVLEQYEANLAFHARLLDPCPNRELVALVGDVRGRGAAAPLTEWRTPARVGQSAREHRAMVEALRARDAADLAAVIRRHILQDDTAPPGAGTGDAT